MLVVLGVVLISEVSRYFGGADPSRIAAQIITGIGFLGAGTIMRQGAEVKGLTTAASIWAASAIGMAVSVGGAFYWVAVISTALCLTTLTYVDRLDRRLNPLGHPRELIISLTTRADLVNLMQALSASKVEVRSVKVLDEGPPTQVALTVAGSGNGVLPVVSTLPGVAEVRWA
jgi:putative Mg2+ transporter-C (MgtC) family protein